MALVISPRVGHRERLKDPTDRLPGFGPEEQVEMIGHQTITKKPKRITLLGLAQCFQKGDVIRSVFENATPVVAPVQGVENETTSDGTR